MPTNLGTASASVLDDTIFYNCSGLGSVTFPETSARYLKVTAACLEALPEWHSGKGNPGFVFVDEIVVL